MSADRCTADTAGDDEEGRRKQEEADGREEGRRVEGRKGRKEGEKEGSLPEPHCRCATEENEGGAGQRIGTCGFKRQQWGEYSLTSKKRRVHKRAVEGGSGVEGSHAIWEKAAFLATRVL